MRSILGQRPLRYVFAANVISMLGSGMNSAAVAWYILEATHSEMALGTFAVLQTIPAMLMLPFTGVIIDREDRRRRRVAGAGVEDHADSLPAQGAGLAALPDEHSGFGRILDVLANHHCPDPGTHAGGRFPAIQYLLAGGRAGRLADRRSDCGIHV